MTRKRITQVVLSVLVIPVFMGAAVGTVAAADNDIASSRLLAQATETPTQPTQPAQPEQPAETPAEPEEPAAESPAEPAEPAEPAKPAPKSNLPLLIGGGLAALVLIALISSLLRRPRGE